MAQTTLVNKLEAHLQTQAQLKLELIARLKFLDTHIKENPSDCNADTNEWSQLYYMGEKIFGEDWY
jgi:hypothetical protein